VELSGNEIEMGLPCADLESVDTCENMTSRGWRERSGEREWAVSWISKRFFAISGSVSCVGKSAKSRIEKQELTVEGANTSS
jgi:hypothetical protein